MYLREDDSPIPLPADGCAELPHPNRHVDLADGSPYRLHARSVAFELAQLVAAGPAAVAVQDDRDVVRQVLERDDRLERRQVGGGRGTAGGWLDDGGLDEFEGVVRGAAF